MSEDRRREHGSNLERLETAPELKKVLILNLSSSCLFKLQAKIIWHAVDEQDVSIQSYTVIPAVPSSSVCNLIMVDDDEIIFPPWTS